MRYLVPAILFACVLGAGAAHAGTAEVRDVAISNSCPPKKIEIFQQPLGSGGKTVYRVQCTLAKTVASADAGAKPPDALLIDCEQNMCDVLRPVASDQK